MSLASLDANLTGDAGRVLVLDCGSGSTRGSFYCTNADGTPHLFDINQGFVDRSWVSDWLISERTLLISSMLEFSTPSLAQFPVGGLEILSFRKTID